ncbi:MAG: hypothetical protein IPN32_37040 [Deltaproteobacteria bacterium]|nr:hypothetical protein [Deltaproteobacteria bacterium]
MITASADAGASTTQAARTTAPSSRSCTAIASLPGTTLPGKPSVRVRELSHPSAVAASNVTVVPTASSLRSARTPASAAPARSNASPRASSSPSLHASTGESTASRKTSTTSEDSLETSSGVRSCSV